MKSIALSLVAVLNLASGTAHAGISEVRAQSVEDAPSVVVRYSELDLMREDGARALIARIGQAAKAVCGPKPAFAALGSFDAYRTCVAESTASAVRRVNAPLVSGLYRGGWHARLLAAR